MVQTGKAVDVVGQPRWVLAEEQTKWQGSCVHAPRELNCHDTRDTIPYK